MWRCLADVVGFRHGGPASQVNTRDVKHGRYGRVGGFGISIAVMVDKWRMAPRPTTMSPSPRYEEMLC